MAERVFKNESEVKKAIADLTAKLSPDLKSLIADYETEKMPISEISDNIGVSAGFVKMYITQGIAFLPYDPSKCNVFGLEKILKKAKANADKEKLPNAEFLTIEKFSYESLNWKKGETKQPKVIIDWETDQKVQFSNSHGQQSPTCIYKVVWLNDGYLLVVPVENVANDEKGAKIDNPRILSKLVASNMKPVFIIPEVAEVKTTEA